MAALQISRKIDYALRALMYLAEVDGRGRTLGDIAQRTAVSPHFLAKIIELLAHRGIVRSRRSARGGYVLARPAQEVSFKDVIEAVEGPIVLNTCTGGGDDCVLLPGCRMMSVWEEAQQRLVEVFTRTTLADVCRGCAPGAGAAAVSGNGRVAHAPPVQQRGRFSTEVPGRRDADV